MVEFKVVVVGGGGVGKSALTIRFMRNFFVEEYDPTIEENYRKQVQVDEDVCLLDILDTAGQEEFNAMRDSYMRGGQGFILVYSIIDRESFNRIPLLHAHLLQTKENPIVPCVLVGNKSDMAEDREVSLNEGQQLAKSFNCPYLEASARDRVNVDEIFFEVVRQVRTQDDKNPNKSKKKKAGFCSLLSGWPVAVLTRYFKLGDLTQTCKRENSSCIQLRSYFCIIRIIAKPRREHTGCISMDHSPATPTRANGSQPVVDSSTRGLFAQVFDLINNFVDDIHKVEAAEQKKQLLIGIGNLRLHMETLKNNIESKEAALTSAEEAARRRVETLIPTPPPAPSKKTKAVSTPPQGDDESKSPDRPRSARIANRKKKQKKDVSSPTILAAPPPSHKKPPTEEPTPMVTENRPDTPADVDSADMMEGTDEGYDTAEEDMREEGSGKRKPMTEEEKSNRKRRGNLPEMITNALKRWIVEHWAHPYPSDEEKVNLCATTGLTLTQLNNWFTNSRRRYLKPKQGGYRGQFEPPTTHQVEAILIDEITNSAMMARHQTAAAAAALVQSSGLVQPGGPLPSYSLPASQDPAAFANGPIYGINGQPYAYDPAYMPYRPPYGRPGYPYVPIPPHGMPQGSHGEAPQAPTPAAAAAPPPAASEVATPAVPAAAASPAASQAEPAIKEEEPRPTYPRYRLHLQLPSFRRARVCPKMGRVCVPIDPHKCDEFDPTRMPDLSTLVEQSRDNRPIKRKAIQKEKAPAVKALMQDGT
ncbi:hypothetical protein PROFUN_02361 [Planoprotostelium fungivorum]|uniref:small monomeric GTPase n=1 Tax=Planoprotostelium fungivorum TaxID=1890364 RepID=A0A2P6NUM0_9EUKA|nr:hypothetical protein PROFUN_02361 [Planoprotostelium fungivorum]